MTTTDLIASISVDGLLRAREQIAANVEAAHRQMRAAHDAAKGLGAGGDGVALNLILELRHTGRGTWFTTDAIAPAVMMKRVDASLWQLLMDRSGLWSLLDEKARDEWHRSLEDAPPLTVDTVRATFAALYERRAEFFDRGVLELFRRLSWDFKSNSPRRFGRRIILERAVSCWKSTSGHRFFTLQRSDALDDLLRVFAVAAGHPEPTHNVGVAAQLRGQTWRVDDPVAVVGVLGVVPACPLFTVKGHANGNAHVVFSRPDLVDDLNRIIAKHHANVLPPADA